MGFRQKQQLLAAVHQAEAENPARADRDFRLIHLVVGIGRAGALRNARLDPAPMIDLGDELQVRIDPLDHTLQPVGFLPQWP